jgi:hypothetical protein
MASFLWAFPSIPCTSFFLSYLSPSDYFRSKLLYVYRHFVSQTSFFSKGNQGNVGLYKIKYTLTEIHRNVLTFHFSLHKVHKTYGSASTYLSSPKVLSGFRLNLILVGTILVGQNLVKVKVKVMLRPTSWNKAPIWGLRPDLCCYQRVAGLLMWDALSDESTGLSFARVTVSSNKSVVNIYNLHSTCY